MSKKDKSKDDQKDEAAPSAKDETGGGDGNGEKLSTGGWDDAIKPRWKKFPGPEGLDEAHRISMSRSAYAELINHAKESLNAEICGVMVGQLCEDERGLFITVEGIVRGTAAKEAGTHVTFTQDTWNAIHEAKERDFPKLQIVGWYHSHPGFGVEFSEMDLFIQRNFFSGPMQVAFVTDPLGGEEAICVNGDRGIANVSRFWVEGRERRCYTPSASGATAGTAAVPAEVNKSLQAMEDRMRQIMQMIESQHAAHNRVLYTGFFLVLIAVALFIGWMIRVQFMDLPRPPTDIQFIPEEIMMDGQPVMIGIQLKGWNVPEKLNAAIVQAQKQLLKEAADEKAKEEAAEKAREAAATQQAATMSATQPAGNPK